MGKLRLYLLVLCAVAASGGVALAQTPLHRSPVQRQTVVQLAYVLGEAHALHRLCAGAADATWYARMQRLEMQEGADEGFRRQLVDSFNAGFASRQAEYLDCDAASQSAERAAAARGAALARRLAAGGED